MSVKLVDGDFTNAASRMEALKTRNDNLKTKLENMFNDLMDALDTPAGHSLNITGRDVLLQPIEDMGLVIKHMSETLNTIIGKNGVSNVYYDKIFDEYNDIDRILKNKTTR